LPRPSARVRSRTGGSRNPRALQRTQSVHPYKGTITPHDRSEPETGAQIPIWEPKQGAMGLPKRQTMGRPNGWEAVEEVYEKPLWE